MSSEGDAGQGEGSSSGVNDADDDEEDCEGPGGSAEGREIKWGILPEGLQVAPKPDTLDASLIDRLIYMRWDAPYGWLVGTVKEKFDQSMPRLFRKFNYCIKW